MAMLNIHRVNPNPNYSYLLDLNAALVSENTSFQSSSNRGFGTPCSIDKWAKNLKTPGFIFSDSTIDTWIPWGVQWFNQNWDSTWFNNHSIGLKNRPKIYPYRWNRYLQWIGSWNADKNIKSWKNLGQNRSDSWILPHKTGRSRSRLSAVAVALSFRWTKQHLN